MNDCKTIISVIAISTTIVLAFIGFIGANVVSNSADLKEHQLEPAHGVALEKFNNIENKVIENNMILKKICNGNCLP